MKILVSGASGFVGYTLVKTLLEQHGFDDLILLVHPHPRLPAERARLEKLQKMGLRLIPVDLLGDLSSLHTIEKVDLLYHLAAFGETETRTDAVRVNDLGSSRLLQTLGERLHRTHVIYSGTIASVDRKYPSNTPLLDTSHCHPRTIYGATKLAGEKIIRELSEQFGYSWTILRLPTIYGPEFRAGGIFQILAEGLTREAIFSRLNWPGRVGLLHVQDLAKILIAISQDKNAEARILHAPSPDCPSLDQIASLVAAAINVERRQIKLPAWFWRAITALVWTPGLHRILPFFLHNVLWRVSLVTIDGLVSKGSDIIEELNLSYSPIDKGFFEMYENW